MNDIKELLYDIQREKSLQKQAELIQTFVDKKVYAEILNSFFEQTEDINNAHGYIQELEGELERVKFNTHKFPIGTKIQFPTFEKLRLEGWVDDGEYIVHPIYKNVMLSYLQLAEHEDTMVTISHQNNPGEYCIEEDDCLYNDWPLDLMTNLKFKQ